MSEITLSSLNWKFVELGRVVLIKKGPDAGKLAAIVEIVDHRRILVDSPKEVARQALALNHVSLTPFVIPSVPKSAAKKTLTKKWEAAGIDSKWASSSIAKKIAQQKRRSELTDFERFQAAHYKKQHYYDVEKAAAKA